MNDILIRIKRAVVEGRYRFADKAEVELEADGLSKRDVIESIINAKAIWKTLRSKSRVRGRARERLYVVIGPNLNGLLIYTKGKLIDEGGEEIYYVHISAKKSLP